MTNEEAVKIIKSECYIADLLNLDRTRMVNTALDLAIKALEQQLCEDCVSRKAVMFEIDESYNIVDLEKRIKDLPSVQPTRPKGKWIPYYDRWGDVITNVSHFKCSVCGEYDYDKDKFCPNCGADMRGEAE